MTCYVVCVFAVALCLACAGVSGKEQQQQEPLTSVGAAESRLPNRLTKMPKTLRRGMTPEEEAEALREMEAEDNQTRRQCLEESKAAEAALESAKGKWKLAVDKLAALKAEREKTKETAKSTEETTAEKDEEEAKRTLQKAQSMYDVAKTALRNSQYVVLHLPMQGDGRRSIGDGTAGMGRRSERADSALIPTVFVNAVLLLLFFHALMN